MKVLSCPLCKTRTQFEVYKKGFLSGGFRIRCPACEAEWVHTSKSESTKIVFERPKSAFEIGWEMGTKSVVHGKAFPIDDLIKDDSIWVLKKPDRIKLAINF